MALSEKQRQAALALASHPTVASASRKCGVAITTLYLWMRTKEEFRKEIERIRKCQFEQAVRYLQSLVSKSLKVFRETLDLVDKPTLRLKAAQYIVDNALKFDQALTVAGKLDELQSGTKVIEEEGEAEESECDSSCSTGVED